MDTFIETEQKFSSGLYSLKPFRIEKGEGVYLYSSDGTKYLDFMSGHGVACLGHSHPKLVNAIKDQAGKIITLHGAYPTEIRAKFHEAMAQITPKSLTKSFMVNSGTEAVEGAIKLAISNNRYVSKPNIVAMKRSFHGRTLGSLALTFNPLYKKAFKSSLNPEIRFASFNDIESVKSVIDENTIAIISELVQGEGGVHPATNEFAKSLKELSEEKGILLIVDEVQTGMGRCGEMFACQHYDIEPDILCTAKGTGGGVPLGTIVSTEDIWKKMKKGEHASTFGGNALAAAAGYATIQTLLDEKIPQNAKKMGNLIVDKLKEIDQTKIRDIRGLGLLIGIQLRAKMGPFLKYCQEKEHVLFLPAGMTVLRMLPPLIIDESNAISAVNAFKNAIDNI